LINNELQAGQLQQQVTNLEFQKAEQAQKLSDLNVPFLADKDQTVDGNI
jgi:uncharacterized coiled-coil protein SlyX